MFKMAHLWLNPLSPMAHLTMIAPKDGKKLIYYIRKKSCIQSAYVFIITYCNSKN